MSKVIKNAQREVDPMALQKLPPRGTGRKTGTAKKPTGKDDQLTEKERKKRHEEMLKKKK